MEDRKEEARRLKEKAKLLWLLVTTTSGVPDLAEPMKRAEHDFSRLTKAQRLTVAVIANQFAKGCDEIDTREIEKVKQTVVNPEEVEVIPPGVEISKEE